MAKPQADQPLVPSLLDRLIDRAPEEKRELPKSRSQVLRELKQSVRSDLEHLLNTHCRCRMLPPGLEELDRSLACYGIPDIRVAELSSGAGQQLFVRILEDVIGKFESRLQNVRVIPLEDADPEDRILRFRIEAMLRMEPAPEPVAFDSAMQQISGNIEVRGGGR